MPRRRRHGGSGAVDPFAVLGLSPGSTVDEVENARRALAKSSHPDVGGSVGDMQRINAAADEAARIAGGRGVPSTPASPPPAAPVPPPGPAFHWRVDQPSFTVEALPAESFEALLVVASWLGETIDDDPPYRLDIELTEPVRCWCRLELLPDAGATTVGLAVGSERGVTAADVDAVRDTWIAALNSLDWSGIGDSRRRP
ncbi:MAG TPA: J domain-containing protein [Ilumatobacter sp.]|nr:J domain-containing protein [Ilumatobacter sp.]